MLSTPLSAAPMRHRHVRDGVALSGLALDSIVARGSWEDWGALREVLRARPSLRDPLWRLCIARCGDAEALTARYRD